MNKWKVENEKWKMGKINSMNSSCLQNTIIFF